MKSKLKSLVLLSAGLDSTVNLFLAREKTEVLRAVTFDYGQRAAIKELSCARTLAQALQIDHQVISLPFFKEFQNSSLLNSQLGIPVGAQIEIDDLKTSQKSAQSVWVPNRNGIFLNIAAGIAESLGADTVVPGFNIEEATTFPDNTQEFMAAVSKSLYFSTANHIEVKCFTTAMNKIEIVHEGQRLGVDWTKAWPCYFAEDQWCGQCESCQRARRAFAKNNIPWEGLRG